MSLVLAALVLALPDPAPPVYPGKTWTAKAPAEAGLDADRLKAFAEAVGGRGCVVRHGHLVHTWGDAARRADVASACKPWFTHFLLAAVEEGKVAGLDERVARWKPRLKDLNKDRGGKDAAITWRHLANQVSGYGVAEAPGAAFDYSDYNMALFADALLLKVYGTTWEKADADVLHPKLTDRLGCEDRPTLLAFGKGDRPGRLAISARDFARFGLLYLRKGNWNGKQILRAEHVNLVVSSPLPNSVPRTKGQKAQMLPKQRSIGGGANQTDHLGSYSFAWWTNGTDRDGKRHWPDAPPDTYAALGHDSRRALVVIPSLDLVVSWNDAALRGRDDVNRALQKLVKAVK